MNKRVEEVREMRRREELRREEEKRVARAYNTAILVMLALTAAYFGWLAWMKARQPVIEREAALKAEGAAAFDAKVDQAGGWDQWLSKEIAEVR